MSVCIHDGIKASNKLLIHGTTQINMHIMLHNNQNTKEYIVYGSISVKFLEKVKLIYSNGNLNKSCLKDMGKCTRARVNFLIQLYSNTLLLILLDSYVLGLSLINILELNFIFHNCIIS